MTAIEFYNITSAALSDMARMHGVADLEKYYHLTDFLAFPQINGLGEIEQTYMQIAFHGQNATMISNIVSFEKNYRLIKEVLCGFCPRDVLATYCASSREDGVKRLVAAFADKGISSNTQKSTKRPNAIMIRYANALLDAAEYLSAFETKRAVIQDLQNHYATTEELIGYVRSKIKNGFSVALTCDFLKEYAAEFNNLPKPDVHIMDTMRVLYDRNKNYYAYDRGAFRCIADVQMTVDEINRELAEESRITVYQLDRMIWLVCANKFFLDQDYKTTKTWYLSKLV